MYVGVLQRKQNNAALETPVSICSLNAGMEKSIPCHLEGNDQK